MTRKIEADWNTIVRFWLVPLIIAGVLFLLYNAATGLIIIGASIFLALALKPLVRGVNNIFTKIFGGNKKHQTISVVFAYLIVIAVIGAIVAVVGPVVVNETSKFVQNFPETFEKTVGGWEGVNNFGKSIGVDDLHMEITNALDELPKTILGSLGSNLMSGVSGVADIIMKIVLVLVLTLLMLLEGPTMLETMWKNVGARKEKKRYVNALQRLIVRMANVVSTYVSRQVMVAILDGCATIIIVFVLSLILGFSPNLAIPMGMITMLFYLIPMFGQFIGGTLVTVLLFFSNPLAAGIFAVIYILYSQIENNLISPKIQGNALNLQPLIILCAVVIGMYMFGLFGAIIAIPIAGCIRVIIEEIPNLRAAREQNV